MKSVLFVLIVVFNLSAFAQELPSPPANGFAFPLGTKFTIKLIPKKKQCFDFSVIAFEPFQDIINSWESDTLFKETEKNGTIEFYFCLSTSGETEQEREDNMKVVLIMKNRTDYHLSYKSDIQTEEGGDFEETSNVGTYSGALTTEMWPYMIYQIGIHDFRVMK